MATERYYLVTFRRPVGDCRMLWWVWAADPMLARERAQARLTGQLVQLDGGTEDLAAWTWQSTVEELD